MANKNNIRIQYFDKGKNISQIKRSTGHSRKTIRNVINQKDFNVAPKEQLLFPPKLSPYSDVIDGWLEADKQFKKKQRHTAKRVYDRLLELYPEFDVSYRTVAKYVKIKRELIWQPTGFLPLSHPGGEAQVDFGKAEYFENGQRINGSYVVMSFPASNAGYSLLYPGESLECLLDGIKTIFDHIGCVPTKIWFDNASSMVIKIKENGERVLSEGFLRFKNHYNFSTSFCNPASGNEKGNVENKVGYIRRNMLVPAPEFKDIEEFNQQQLSRCDKDLERQHYQKAATISDLFLQEKNLMLSLPLEEYEVCRYDSSKADLYGKIRLNKKVYSTSPSLAGSVVTIKQTAHYVYVLNADMRVVVKHKRLYGKQNESMCWLPYLNQLSRKPGAIKYTPIYELLPDNLKAHICAISKKERGKIFKVIAELTQKNSFEETITAVNQTIERGVVDPDSIIATFNRINIPKIELPKLSLSKDLPKLPASKFSSRDYDEFLLGGNF
jgi:transposase